MKNKKYKNWGLLGVPPQRETRGDVGGRLEAPPSGKHIPHLGKRTHFPEFPPKGGHGVMFPQEFSGSGSVGERGGTFPTLGDASPWNAHAIQLPAYIYAYEISSNEGQHHYSFDL